MKIFLIVAVLSCGTCSAGNAQYYYLYQIFDTYFPKNPLDTSFSVFFTNLKSDTALKNQALSRRTDSSLFSFEGNYNRYKKGLRTIKADIKLNEVVLSDSASPVDTFFQYQLVCYLPNESKGKDAFADFDSQYRLAFSKTKDAPIMTDGVESGLLRNYFTSSTPISLVTIARVVLADKQSMFTIIVRMKLEQNELVIYVPEKKKPQMSGPTVIWKN